VAGLANVSCWSIVQQMLVAKIPFYVIGTIFIHYGCNGTVSYYDVASDLRCDLFYLLGHCPYTVHFQEGLCELDTFTL
jgi:hypothetical protein